MMQNDGLSDGCPISRAFWAREMGVFAVRISEDFPANSGYSN